MVNLCNVQPRILQSYGKLYIWKSDFIFPSDKRNYSKLTSSITVKTFSNGHLCKTITCLKRPMLSAESIKANSCAIDTV